MGDKLLAIKVDVDTDRGTRIGVPNLVRLFDEFGIHATFFFSLGPDNTGRAIKRIFRRGFLTKVRRTGVVGIYGARTLLNGLLLPGPHIGRRNEDFMRAVRDHGHEVGIHGFDHIRWQDGLMSMTEAQVREEFGKARKEFERIFREPAGTAGAAGWQANGFSLGAYDDAGLLYASDSRGTHAFFPRVNDRVYKTLQIPTTLPTMDELLGRPEYPEDAMVEHYLSLLTAKPPNILTIHAEIEGMKKIDLFRKFLEQAARRSIRYTRMRDLAGELLKNPSVIPICRLTTGTVDGRSGTLVVHENSRTEKLKDE